MSEVELTPDCTRCAALCCIALAFDKSDSFPIDKPNGVACPNLGEGGGCNVYDHRAELGFRGCIRFDCFGAGQRVTQDIFDGRSWREEPDILPAMVEAFTAMLKVHDLLLLLGEAMKLPLDRRERSAADRLIATLNPTGGWSAEGIASFGLTEVERKVRTFLASLEHHVA